MATRIGVMYEARQVGDATPATGPDRLLQRVADQRLYHCADAAEFHGRAVADELAAFPDALAYLRKQTEQYGWPADQIERCMNALRKDGPPTAYLFRCRHCGTHPTYSDFTGLPGSDGVR